MAWSDAARAAAAEARKAKAGALKSRIRAADLAKNIYRPKVVEAASARLGKGFKEFDRIAPYGFPGTTDRATYAKALRKGRASAKRDAKGAKAQRAEAYKSAALFLRNPRLLGL